MNNSGSKGFYSKLRSSGQLILSTSFLQITISSSYCISINQTIIGYRSSLARSRQPKQVPTHPYLCQIDPLPPPFYNGPIRIPSSYIFSEPNYIIVLSFIPCAFEPIARSWASLISLILLVHITTSRWLTPS